MNISQYIETVLHVEIFQGEDSQKLRLLAYISNFQYEVIHILITILTRNRLFSLFANYLPLWIYIYNINNYRINVSLLAVILGCSLYFHMQ